MKKFVAIAAGLTLASGVALAAGGAQAPTVEQRTTGGEHGVWVARADSADGAPLIRKLRVLAGRGAELGVTIRDVDAATAGATGAVVEGVREGSPADKAGIKKGDVIAEFDGERVRSARQLSRLVAETPDGRTVKAGLVREGKHLEVSVTPESGEMAGREFEHEFVMPPEGRFEPGMPGEPGNEARRFFFDVRPPADGAPGWFAFEPRRGRLGVGIQDLSPQLAEYFGVTDGVLVTSVEPDSPAAKAALKAGDVITSVNGKPVDNSGALVDAVRSAADGGDLTIGYSRDRKTGTTKATLPAPERPKVRAQREEI